jgi:DNA helicase II / ATP-dependent DNA helicase PcrA
MARFERRGQLPSSAWIRLHAGVAATSRFRFTPRSREARRRQPSWADLTLDAAQRAAVELPPAQPLLVLGEAGHGKTVVLVHRVARIWNAVGGKLRAAVLVPTEGLVRLVQAPLQRLGADVDVWTFDRFAHKQARRAFRRLPPESDGAPPSVMRLKRSPALRVALKELAAREPGLVDEDRDAPVRRSRSHISRGDLQHLFGDRLFMQRVAREGKLPAHAVEDTLDRTRVQFSATTEGAWSDVIDRSRLVAVDRQPLDWGTPTEHASTIDVEDYAVLFELDRMRAARRKAAPTQPRPFDLIAIDEAQELAPLELALIGRSLAPGGTLVVAGDRDQHTDESTTFLGWEEVMRELDAPGFATTVLEIGYRCAPDVVRLARAVRDGGAPVEATVEVFDDERRLARDLGGAAATLLRRDARASIAVICRLPMTARRLTPLLQEHVAARVVFDGRFRTRGAVQVAVVDDVKGLEFDYVIVPDASATHWPDEPRARRAMYVAVTRARHEVLLACTGEPSPVLVA